MVTSCIFFQLTKMSKPPKSIITKIKIFLRINLYDKITSKKQAVFAIILDINKKAIKNLHMKSYVKSRLSQTVQKLTERYMNSLVGICVFGALITLAYAAYRIKIWFYIREFFQSLHEMSFFSYFTLFAKTDALMLFLSFCVIICIFIFISRPVVRYIAASFFVLANVISLSVGVIIFRIYEVTMQKSLWTNEIAAEWTSIFFSMFSEIPVYLFAGIIFISALLVLSSLWLARREKLREKIKPDENAFLKWSPAAFSLVLFILIIFTGKNVHLETAAAKITAVPKKQALQFLADISMNPNYNLLFEKNPNKITLSDTFFDALEFNTDSIYSNKHTKRINLIPRGKNYNIILYMFESTHHKMVDAKINGQWITPVWRRLFEHGIRGLNHYANYPLSANALLSLLASVYEHPGRELIIQNYPHVPLETIPEILRSRGYKSLIIHSGTLLYVNQIEFLRHRFDKTVDAKAIRTPQYNYNVGWGLDERAMTAPILSFIKENQGHPFFITVMPVNPHHPYSIPEKDPVEAEKFRILKVSPSESIRQKNRRNYINSLHYADASLGHLVDALEAENMMENTILIVVGDHGEAFYEHQGNYNHPFFIYEENVHVPLVIYSPSLIKTPLEINNITRHIDILPTILDLLGMNSIQPMGVSMLSNNREQMALLHTNWKHHLIGVRDGRWKYIRRMKDSFQELYDLEADPDEADNIAELNPDITRRYYEFTDRARNFKIAFYNNLLAGITRKNLPSVFDIKEFTFEEYQDKKNKPKEDGTAESAP
ncbi:MAG: sulfatase-like hydrolase/transferase [Leptospirales bacterium]|nr:sulfatase-like hydrolase/transferase [Leptospirales bacterium]